MIPVIDDLEHTRAAFDSWRASNQGRRRIPDRLWKQALALLDHYSLSRICRELRISAAQLRKQKAATASFNKTQAPAQHFFEIQPSDLKIDSVLNANSTIHSRTQASHDPLHLGVQPTRVCDFYSKVLNFSQN